MTAVTITRLSLAEIEAHLDAIRSTLTKEECQKAERFLRREDRLLSYGGAYLIRRVIGGNAVIRRGAFGKPYADGMYFNISHSGDLVAIAFCSTQEVGLDLERKRPGFDELIPYCLTDAERDSGADFLTLFCAKESLGKAEGEGLTDMPGRIPALPTEGAVRYRNAVYYRHMLPDESYVISICVRGSDFVLKEEPIDVF